MSAIAWWCFGELKIPQMHCAPGVLSCDSTIGILCPLNFFRGRYNGSLFFCQVVIMRDGVVGSQGQHVLIASTSAVVESLQVLPTFSNMVKLPVTVDGLMP